MRGAVSTPELYRGGLARRLLAPKARRRGSRARSAGLEPEPPRATGSMGTTHISAVDARGNAASLTASTGAGSGVVVPGTGIHLNNMLGEYELRPAGGDGRPGARLTSMMAPSLVLAGAAPRLVVGSAGSLRLRGAILQAVVNVVRHELPVSRRRSRARACTRRTAARPLRGRRRPGRARPARAAAGTSSCAGAAGTSSSAACPPSRPCADGTLAAAGDPRRGGAGVVVGVNGVVVRPADPRRRGGARPARRRGSASEPEGWLISAAAGAARATSAATCGRLRRSRDAAVFVAEADGRSWGGSRSHGTLTRPARTWPISG